MRWAIALGALLVPACGSSHQGSLDAGADVDTGAEADTGVPDGGGGDAGPEDRALACLAAIRDDVLPGWVRGAPGVAVAVAHRGTVVGTAVAGVLENGAAPEIQTSTRFGAAGLTRVITAMAVADAVGDLDDPIGTYVPGLGAAGDVTVRQLLSGRSGLEARHDFGCDPETESLESYLEDHPPQVWATPGETFSDQWTEWKTFALLGRVLEGASEGTEPTELAPILDDFVQHRLGMPTASFARGAQDATGHTGFAPFVDPVADPVDCPHDAPADGLYASIEDIGRLAALLSAPEDEREPFVRTVLDLDEPPLTGLSSIPQSMRFQWSFSDDGSAPWAGKGSPAGYWSEIEVLPAEGIAIVVLANISTGVDVGALYSACELHFPDGCPAARDESEYGQYEGTYEDRAGVVTAIVDWDPEVRRLEATVTGLADDLDGVGLSPGCLDTFSFPLSGASVSLQFVTDGQSATWIELPDYFAGPADDGSWLGFPPLERQ